MARATTLVDDMDGTPGAQERKFTIGGTSYSIDLTDQNYQKLLEAIEPFRSNAKVRRARKNRAPVLTPEDRAAIRVWAAENGKALAPRGRFPNVLVNEYYRSLEQDKQLVSV
jgi:hypothetical protein